MADDNSEKDPASSLHKDSLDDLDVADDEEGGAESEGSEPEERPREGGPSSGASGEWRGHSGSDQPA
jgi:hypothetical protein